MGTRLGGYQRSSRRRGTGRGSFHVGRDTNRQLKFGRDTRQPDQSGAYLAQMAAGAEIVCLRMCACFIGAVEVPSSHSVKASVSDQSHGRPDTLLEGSGGGDTSLKS